MNNEALVLDGTKVAEELRQQTAERAAGLKARGIVPCLATVLVGDDPASATYVRMKGNACRRIGIESRKVVLSATTDTQALIQAIRGLNDDPSVHGILLQHPVPDTIDERAAFEAIAPEKDVDGVTLHGFAQTAFGMAAFPSCTPAAILAIMDAYGLPMDGKHAVVIGRSPILGKPVALMLLGRNATVTICHSRTVDLAEHVRQADIVVAAVGRPALIQGDWIKPGAIVLDAGYNPGNIGDVDYAGAREVAGAITPVPGGVGPVTIAMLLKHTVDAAERKVTE